MWTELSLAGARWRADLGRPLPIAIGLNFEGSQPNHFGVPRAVAAPVKAGEFVGDTRRGGGCNVDEVRLTPHCNGTHTECVGHILDERVAVHDVLGPAIVPCTVVSVTPEPRDGEEVVTAVSLASHLDAVHAEHLTAVAIRTLPNPVEKASRTYTPDAPPAFLTRRAAEYLDRLDAIHLLVDFPSLDPMHDEGRLTAHHIWFRVPEGGHAAAPGTRTDRTVTEMIYIPDEVQDGHYLLSLQVAPFLLDAAPSRPVLHPMEPR